MFLMTQQQLSRCDRVMQQRVKPYIHSVLSHCLLRSYDIPGEPIASQEFFERVSDGRVAFQEFHAPGSWGTTWGTTWFEIRGNIDLEAVAGKTVELDIDLGWLDSRGPGFQAEGLVYRADGTAVKTANPRNSWIPLVGADGTRNVDFDSEGNFVLYMEAASNPFVEGDGPFAPTNLGECATGRDECHYVLRHVDITIFNHDIFNYYMDLETVSSLIRELKDDDPRYWQLAKALQRSLNIHDERDTSTIQPARDALAQVLANPASASALKHIAVGHAHIDSAWLWPIRETHRKVARTVANVLALMDEDPEFIYAMSSAQQYEWLENEHPDIFATMKQRIREGRFIPVGGMWVESDGMIPSGESLIRQMTFGKRYFKEHLGVEPHGIWLPDSFGYTGAWPQLARRAGFTWFLTQKISWNDTTKFPHHSFLWEGVDGSRILTHFPPSDTYCSPMSMHELCYSQRNFLDKDLSDHAILLYGFGDGGGGPTREMTARIRRARNLEGAPRVDFGTPDELFEQVKQDLVEHADGETPVFKGELYLELHRATLTSQQEMKRYCRMEESLLRVTEYLIALAKVYAPEYQSDQEGLVRIWKTLLLNQFHDILPGSAIAWVHRQAREDYQRDVERLREMIADIAQAIQRANPDMPMQENAQILTYECAKKGSWAIESVNKKVQEKTQVVQHDDGSVELRNSRLRVIIENDGTVSSLQDVCSKRELIASGMRMGRYELLKDQPFHWDAWDIQRDAFLTNRPMNEASIESIDRLETGGAVVHVLTRQGSVAIRTAITLQPNAKNLDFHANVDWHTAEQFLKVDMPLAVCATKAQYECQYGLVERPIAKNTRSDEAKFESCTHRFVRIAESNYAIAVVNASTYGSDVSPIAEENNLSSCGTMLRLSLLSSPLYPDPHTDQGSHQFTWSVVVDADMDSVLEEASRLNAPVVDALPDVDPLLSLEKVSGSIAVDWIKLADDGSGDVIVRLYEAAGGSASGVVKLAGALGKVTLQEVDLLEEPELHGMSQGLRQQDDAWVVSLHAFQLCTIRIHSDTK